MSIGGLHLHHPDTRELDERLTVARRATATYDHVGSTLDPTDARYARARSHSVDIGCGEAALDLGREALHRWAAHAGVGFAIAPPDARLEVGVSVLVVARLGPITILAPVRVVRVVDEPRRFGFAYGTLPGHPERGEESFVIEHLEDDRVRATIRVDARPASPLATVAWPIVRWLQARALHGYLAAIETFVRASADGRPPR